MILLTVWSHAVQAHYLTNNNVAIESLSAYVWFFVMPLGSLIDELKSFSLSVSSLHNQI